MVTKCNHRNVILTVEGTDNTFDILYVKVFKENIDKINIRKLYSNSINKCNSKSNLSLHITIKTKTGNYFTIISLLIYYSVSENISISLMVFFFLYLYRFCFVNVLLPILEIPFICP